MSVFVVGYNDLSHRTRQITVKIPENNQIIFMKENSAAILLLFCPFSIIIVCARKK